MCAYIIVRGSIWHSHNHHSLSVNCYLSIPPAIIILFFSSFLLKDGHGIFNLRNDLSGSACCAREGETGTGDDFALHEWNTRMTYIFTIKIILQVKSFKSNWGYLSLAKSMTLVLPTFSSHSQALLAEHLQVQNSRGLRTALWACFGSDLTGHAPHFSTILMLYPN